MADTPETTPEGIGAEAAEAAAKVVKKGKKAALKVVDTVAEQTADVAQAVETAAEETTASASTRFGKAIEDAKTSAATLKGEALDRTAALTETVTATVTATASDLGEKATVYAEQAKVVALDLARQGKTKATGALSVIGETIENNAGVIDEKLGVQYGDYARGAAHTLQSTAASLEAKDIPEIGEDIAGFVRKSPVKALGIAAATGFLLSRLLRRSGSSSDSSDA
ncbi:MAG: hypothetical protein ACKVOL_02145 [Novosphingobium sp.]